MIYTLPLLGNAQALALSRFSKEKFILDSDSFCFGQYKRLEMHYSNGENNPVPVPGMANITFSGCDKDVVSSILWIPAQ